MFLLRFFCFLGFLATVCSLRAVELNGLTFTVADGYTLSTAVPASLVERPVEACFDDKGRLYVTESSGSNDGVEQQLAQKPHRLWRLEDADGDGVFEKRTLFADKLMFPAGVLWHRGVVYVAAPPQIWKFTDTDDDGVADTREDWYDGKTLTGCANDLHGPYAGPDGLIYWCKGAFAEQTHDLPQYKGWKSRAAHVFCMTPEGKDFDCVFTAGMDNPVGLEWLPEGDLIVSGTFLQHPGDGKRDGLIHAVRGGLWGKDHDVLEGHPRTGPLMPAMVHMGPAAPCGMCRYGRDLLVCQFNMRKVSLHALEPLGATWQTKDSDFLSCEHPDFHPTDVLQSPDGSVLVVDTGGWYKLCCPTSQLARPDVLGGVYRLRKSGGEVPVACPEPRWKLEKPGDFESLKAQMQSPNPHIKRTAIEALGKLPPPPELAEREARNRQILTLLLEAAAQGGEDRFLEHAIIFAALPLSDAPLLNAALGAAPGGMLRQRLALYCLSQSEPGEAERERVVALLASADSRVREAAVFGLQKVPAWREAAGIWLKERMTGGGDPAMLRAAVQAVAAEDSFRPALGAWLTAAPPGPTRHMLLEVMAGLTPWDDLPWEWAEPLLAVLEADDSRAATLAAVVLSRQPPRKRKEVRGKLRSMAGDALRPIDVRVPLLLALSPLTLEAEEFTLLLSALRGKDQTDQSDLKDTAAAVLSQASLSPAQLTALAPQLVDCRLVHRPLLLRAFSKATDKTLGLALVEHLEKSGALAALSAQDAAECLGKFPPDVQQRLTAAQAKLNPGAAEQKARLDTLERTLPAGDALRGKVVFQSAKASCALCHQAGYLGKQFGPDLSKIGGIRTRRDLLEAIAFPSASFVRSYEPVEVKRKDGTLAYGILRSQNGTGLTLRTGAVTPDVTVPAADIDTLTPGAASLMPQGIDLILTPQELADITAFLLSLR